MHANRTKTRDVMHIKWHEEISLRSENRVQWGDKTTENRGC